MPSCPILYCGPSARRWINRADWRSGYMRWSARFQVYRSRRQRDTSLAGFHPAQEVFQFCNEAVADAACQQHFVPWIPGKGVQETCSVGGRKAAAERFAETAS